MTHPPSPSEAEELAKGLTKAQRDALLYADRNGGRFGGLFGDASPVNFERMKVLRFQEEPNATFPVPVLTTLGRAVSRILQKEGEAG